MENPQYLHLPPSKSVVAQMAATIFSGFVQTGELREDNEDELVARAVAIAIKLANRTEAQVTTDEVFTPPPDKDSSFLVG
jgi:hypothetical protein